MQNGQSEETMKICEVIMEYFEETGMRRVTRSELKQLTKEERAEIAELCAAELGVRLE